MGRVPELQCLLDAPLFASIGTQIQHSAEELYLSGSLARYGHMRCKQIISQGMETGDFQEGSLNGVDSPTKCPLCSFHPPLFLVHKNGPL